MTGKFEVYKDKADNYRFRLKASNGQIILASEAYNQKAGAMNGVESVKSNAPKDERYERMDTRNGKPMFNLKAANNQIIGTSEQYETTQGRENGIESVKKTHLMRMSKFSHRKTA